MLKFPILNYFSFTVVVDPTLDPTSLHPPLRQRHSWLMVDFPKPSSFNSIHYFSTCSLMPNSLSIGAKHRRVWCSVDVGGIWRHAKFLTFQFTVDYIRNLVSKNRRRLFMAGFNLGISYITDRKLLMSFSAEHMRVLYRNPLWQVKTMLEIDHARHYKVYNICLEESYDPTHFHGCEDVFPFDDHHVPPLSMLKLFSQSVHS